MILSSLDKNVKEELFFVKLLKWLEQGIMKFLGHYPIGYLMECQLWGRNSDKSRSVT